MPPHVILSSVCCLPGQNRCMCNEQTDAVECLARHVVSQDLSVSGSVTQKCGWEGWCNVIYLHEPHVANIIKLSQTTRLQLLNNCLKTNPNYSFLDISIWRFSCRTACYFQRLAYCHSRMLASPSTSYPRWRPSNSTHPVELHRHKPRTHDRTDAQ